MAPPRKKHGGKNRKTKTIIEFDEKARADYLTGFQKRKKERKSAALEKKDQLIKEERKALRQQMRDLKTNKSLSKSEMLIPEIDTLVEPEVFDLPEHTVTISNIGQVDFVGKAGLRLGQNTGQVASDSENENNKSEEEEKEEEEKSDKSQRENTVCSKSLFKKMANCSNQLSSQLLKSRKSSRRQKIQAKLQAKRVKRKKKHMNKPKKR